MSKNRKRHQNAFRNGVKKAEAAILASLMTAIDDGEDMSAFEVKHLIADATAALLRNEERMTATEVISRVAQHESDAFNAALYGNGTTDNRLTVTWPPLKKALWDVVMAHEVNGGKYIHAFDFVEKLHKAVVTASGELRRQPAPSVVCATCNDTGKEARHQICRDCDGYNCDDGCAYPGASPAPSVAVKAEELARQLWGYFKGDSTGGTTAMQWFDNNKSLGGPARIIELCRSALSAQVQDVAGLESNPVTLRWWCQQLLDIIENYDISHDSCDEEIALINDIRSSVDPAAPAKQEETPRIIHRHTNIMGDK